MTDAGTDKASGLASEVLLPPAEMDLWGLGAGLYADGSDADRQVQMDALRAWAGKNLIRVVASGEDGVPSCTWPVERREGLSLVLMSLLRNDGDALVMVGDLFARLTVTDQGWLLGKVREFEMRLISVDDKGGTRYESD
jgi:hypothetical protein